jgi:hypothetical protein
MDGITFFLNLILGGHLIDFNSTFGGHSVHEKEVSMLSPFSGGGVTQGHGIWRGRSLGPIIETDWHEIYAFQYL